jgi:5-methylcytosine-specific restriction endonuclease McrA
VVDHIIPHKGDKALFWDEKNWQPLCKYCHDSIKAKEEIKQGYM